MPGEKAQGLDSDQRTVDDKKDEVSVVDKLKSQMLKENRFEKFSRNKAQVNYEHKSRIFVNEL